MLDASFRARLAPLWEAVARSLHRRGVAPIALTLLGLGLALAAAAAAALTWWVAALVLWLVSRVPDGLDGPVARIAGRASAFGGWADITADMAAYSAFVVGCAIGQPDAMLACLVLLFAYHVNASSLLAYAAAVATARPERALGGHPGTGAVDHRTLHLSRGLAEGTETIVVHALMVAFPAAMAPLAALFAVVVLLTVLQRVLLARRTLETGG